MARVPQDYNQYYRQPRKCYMQWSDTRANACQKFHFFFLRVALKALSTPAPAPGSTAISLEKLGALSRRIRAVEFRSARIVPLAQGGNATGAHVRTQANTVCFSGVGVSCPTSRR